MMFTCAVAGFFVFTCTSPDTQVGQARFCQTASPITYNAADSAATRRQIRMHNAKGRAVCGWK